MRNMAVLHSPAFSYPLPVLVRVLSNLLIFKGKILYYNKYMEFTESKTIKQNTKMKKRILGAALLVAIAVAAGWNYNQSRNEAPLSDLALANAEALAQGETDWGNCTYYGCIVDFSSTCNVYSSIWGNLIKVCPNMRG